HRILCDGSFGRADPLRGRRYAGVSLDDEDAVDTAPPANFTGGVEVAKHLMSYRHPLCARCGTRLGALPFDHDQSVIRSDEYIRARRALQNVPALRRRIATQ